MLKDNYEKLSLAERETFARVTNQLLAHSFLLSDEFDYKEGISKVNRDYIFLERNYELFTEYLELAGFGLVRDSGYGVVSLTSGYDGSRVHFDKLTTIMLYALRLIYEEEREKLTLSKEVALTVGKVAQNAEPVQDPSQIGRGVGQRRYAHRDPAYGPVCGFRRADREHGKARGGEGR